MPLIDPRQVRAKGGSDYPPPFDAPVATREARDLAAAGGATDWIANHVIVPPGGWSSQRHWHAGEDEIVVILSGKGVLIDDAGRHPVRCGDVAIFPKGDGNGHHFVNEIEDVLVLLALSHSEASQVTYPDIDLLWDPERGQTHRDGGPTERSPAARSARSPILLPARRRSSPA